MTRIGVLLLLLALPCAAEQRRLAPVTVDPNTAQLPSPTLILQQRIREGRASIKDIKQALGVGEVGDVANALTALYSMRRNAEVRELLYALWRDERQQYADLPWERLQHPVVRTAIAAVMNRIAAGTVDELLTYLRGQAEHEDKLVRAQVALALGMTGDLQDLPLLQRYADGDNEYVAQSAILGLGYVYHKQAKEALISLHNTHQDNARGHYIAGILRDVYQWRP